MCIFWGHFWSFGFLEPTIPTNTAHGRRLRFTITGASSFDWGGAFGGLGRPVLRRAASWRPGFATQGWWPFPLRLPRPPRPCSSRHQAKSCAPSGAHVWEPWREVDSNKKCFWWCHHVLYLMCETVFFQRLRCGTAPYFFLGCQNTNSSLDGC